eukprot:352965-Chlamydomonas_euryale.AAC.22
MHVDKACMWTCVCGQGMHVDGECMWTMYVCGQRMHVDDGCMVTPGAQLIIQWRHPAGATQLWAMPVVDDPSHGRPQRWAIPPVANLNVGRSSRRAIPTVGTRTMGNSSCGRSQPRETPAVDYPSGLQKNPDLPVDATVEGVLERALLHAGYIAEYNYGELHKGGLQSCSWLPEAVSMSCCCYILDRFPTCSFARPKCFLLAASLKFSMYARSTGHATAAQTREYTASAQLLHFAACSQLAMHVSKMTQKA